MYDDPVLNSLSDAATALMRQGYAKEKVGQAMLTMGLASAVEREGQRAVARQLYMLALTLTEQADAIEGAVRLN